METFDDMLNRLNTRIRVWQTERPNKHTDRRTDGRREWQ